MRSFQRKAHKTYFYSTKSAIRSVNCGNLPPKFGLKLFFPAVDSRGIIFADVVNRAQDA